MKQVIANIFVLLCCGICGAQDAPSNAYEMSPGAFSAAMFTHQARQILEHNHEIIFGESMEKSLQRAQPNANHAPAPRALTFPAAKASMPKKLAASYAEEKRAEAERVFGKLLAGYGKLEQELGIPKHDVAGTVAGFLAGSYSAYHNTDMPDEDFKALVAQMRAIIGGNADLAKASNAQKQEMYEQMAILGMFMATTTMALQQQPNAQIAANMKQAAKGYLEQFLKASAERVRITAQGLVLK